jgi:two-component system sensor histidine kinase RegB
VNSAWTIRFKEDVQLLRSQSERCRDILRRLTTLSSEDEAHMRVLPLSSLLEEVLAPHREFGIRLNLIENGEREVEPVGSRNPGILYGLGNLLENAVDHAREEVTITVSHTAERVTIVIEDDGDGYAADILQRIGDPYVTKRQRDERAADLGLGLFIAKTLLERSGAETDLRQPHRRPAGRRVSVDWPRGRMEAKGTQNDFTHPDLRADKLILIKNGRNRPRKTKNGRKHRTHSIAATDDIGPDPFPSPRR